MSLTSISSSLLTLLFSFFFFNDTATTEIYTFPYTTLFRSLHLHEPHHHQGDRAGHDRRCAGGRDHHPLAADRKSTRLNSSHTVISYAVFCLKKKEHTSEFQSHSDLVFRLLLARTKHRLL